MLLATLLFLSLSILILFAFFYFYPFPTANNCACAVHLLTSFGRSFKMQMHMLVFVRGQTAVWLVVQCFGTARAGTLIDQSVIQKIATAWLVIMLALDRMDTCCWTHTVADWDQETHRRKKLAVLYCTVLFCGAQESWCCTWCLTEESSAAHYTHQPFRLLLYKPHAETVIVVDTTSYAELSH